MSSLTRILPVMTAVLVAAIGGLDEQAPESGRGYAAQDWPLVSGNGWGSRHSNLVDISTDTVDRGHRIALHGPDARGAPKLGKQPVRVRATRMREAYHA